MLRSGSITLIDQASTKDGLIKIEVILNIPMATSKFVRELPFKIINEKEFEFELRNFCTEFLYEKICSFDERIPQVIEVQILPTEEKNLAFCNVKVDISNYRSDFKAKELQVIMKRDFMDAFFDARIMKLLTQRVVQAEKKRAA